MLQAGAEESVRERGGKGEAEDIHAHLSEAVISWPCNGAFVVLHHEKEKDSDPLSKHRGWRLTSGQAGVAQAASWLMVCLTTAVKPLPLPLSFPLYVSMCVCASLKCLLASFHCCSSGCSQGCVGWLRETQPLSGLLSWCYTKRTDLG